ncbi:LysE/ArgO family amino acid transporter [Cellulomonas marina]|uniref:L-lysine exporter family protein LysE/ArgO n=1 Tax=Cellulomonas marina TaxID=988821 RepID=A0A1I0V533_9CELL|nr:LysE family transporter [Cellulomonas marina]GIG28326.1 amino acid transporter [Cellulomonas marina]SFA71157.1 L-lysine exporter family protein LysE/ArgO [Cellulomonas marina]
MLAALLAALSGLGLGLSLIVAIGSQNAFVLRQGLRREHVGVVVLVCVVSDAVLIAAGVAGAGAAVEAVPGLLTVVRVAGAVFLLAYGVLAARRALRPPAVLEAAGARGPTSVRAAVATTLALTWLNPHVYLDTVVLLGSVAQGHGGRSWWFAAGAVLGSALWFPLLGFGAALLRPLFASPRAWRVLDGLIAVVMVVLAVSLVAGG